MSPPVFVNYRRADEPFAAALTFALLSDCWTGDPVFLDTRFLRQRGEVGRQLLEAVAGSKLVLAVIGAAWDDPERRRRLADPGDWVRRELVAAARTGKPVVPVLVDRGDVPGQLPFEPVPDWQDPIRVNSADFWCAASPLAERVGSVLGDAQQRVDSLHELMPTAVDAMLRHVLPGPQRRMGNDEMVARVVASQLGERDWLRFVATANLPRRPNGSAVVWATSTYLAVADLGSNFRPLNPPQRVGLINMSAIHRVNGRRLWKPVSDVQFALADGAVLDLRGFFAEEADELLEVVSRLRAKARGTGNGEFGNW